MHGYTLLTTVRGQTAGNVRHLARQMGSLNPETATYTWSPPFRIPRQVACSIQSCGHCNVTPLRLPCYLGQQLTVVQDMVPILTS